MSRNGSGTYTLPAGQPVVTGTVIDSSVFNTFTNDVAQALTASIAKDGQTTPSANLPMGGFKHTGVADAALRTQYASAGQVQDGTAQLVNTVAGTDTITGSLSPAITVYAAGMRLAFVPAGTNTGAATINLNALGAKSIVKGSGTALAAGDILSGKIATILYDGTSFILQNPQTNALGTQILNIDGTQSLPSYSFVSDPNTGIYNITGDSIGVATNGTVKLRVNTTTVSTFLPLDAQAQVQSADGLVGSPGYSFSGDTNTGIYRISSDYMAFSAGGVFGGSIVNAGVNPQFGAADGAPGTPGITFDADRDTGFYRAGSNHFIAVVNGQNATEFILNSGVPQTAVTDGSASFPGLSWQNDYDTGFYRVGANSIGIAAGGVQSLGIDTTSVAPALPVRAADGTVGAPTYSFSGDTNTGIYRVTSDDMAIAAGGADVVRFASNAGATPQVRAVDGVVGNPAYSFDSDPDTGFYRAGANDFVASVGGVPSAQFLLNGGVGQTGVADGFASIPGLTFNSDLDTGFYKTGTNAFGVATAGGQTVNFSDVAGNKQFAVADGSAAVPSNSFISDTDTGFYRDTNNQIGIGLGGAPAGQIAQGSFTATFSGFTVNPTPTISYQRIGNIAILTCSSGGAGTSNSTAFGMTGVPVIVTPVSAGKTTQCFLTDNGISLLSGGATISTAGSVTFSVYDTSAVANRVSLNAVGFTASGTKGFGNAWQLIYSVV